MDGKIPDTSRGERNQLQERLADSLAQHPTLASNTSKEKFLPIAGVGEDSSRVRGRQVRILRSGV